MIAWMARHPGMNLGWTIVNGASQARLHETEEIDQQNRSLGRRFPNLAVLRKGVSGDGIGEKITLSSY